jgi:hypothetical protein
VGEDIQIIDGSPERGIAFDSAKAAVDESDIKNE